MEMFRIFSKVLVVLPIFISVHGLQQDKSATSLNIRPSSFGFQSISPVIQTNSQLGLHSIQSGISGSQSNPLNSQSQYVTYKDFKQLIDIAFQEKKARIQLEQKVTELQNKINFLYSKQNKTVDISQHTRPILSRLQTQETKLVSLQTTCEANQQKMNIEMIQLRKRVAELETNAPIGTLMESASSNQKLQMLTNVTNELGLLLQAIIIELNTVKASNSEISQNGQTLIALTTSLQNEIDVILKEHKKTFNDTTIKKSIARLAERLTELENMQNVTQMQMIRNNQLDIVQNVKLTLLENWKNSKYTFDMTALTDKLTFLENYIAEMGKLQNQTWTQLIRNVEQDVALDNRITAIETTRNTQNPHNDANVNQKISILSDKIAEIERSQNVTHLVGITTMQQDAEIRNRMTTIDDKMNELRNNFTSLSSRQINNEYPEIRNKMTALEGQLIDLRNNFTQLSSSETQDKYVALDRRMTAMEGTQNSQKTYDDAEIRNRIIALENEIFELRNNLTQTSLREAQNDNAEIRKRFTSLEDRMIELRNNFTQLSSRKNFDENPEFRNRIAMLENRVFELVNNFTHLNGTHNEYSSLFRDLTAFQNRLGHMEHTLFHLSDQLDTASITDSVLYQNITSFKDRLNSMETALQSTAEQVNTIQAKGNVTMKKVLSLEGDISNLTNSNSLKQSHTFETDALHLDIRLLKERLIGLIQQTTILVNTSRTHESRLNRTFADIDTRTNDLEQLIMLNTKELNNIKINDSGIAKTVSDLEARTNDFEQLVMLNSKELKSLRNYETSTSKVFTDYNARLGTMERIIMLNSKDLNSSRISDLNMEKAIADLRNKLANLSNTSSSQNLNMINTTEKYSNIERRLSRYENDIQQLAVSQNITTEKLYQEIRNATSHHGEQEKIGFTACGGVKSSSYIEFTEIKTAYGLDMGNLYRKGKFYIKDPGYYYVTASILSGSQEGFYIWRNKTPLSSVWFHYSRSSNGYHTASTSAFMKMSRGDVISIRGSSSSFVDPASCITVMRL